MINNKIIADLFHNNINDFNSVNVEYDTSKGAIAIHGYKFLLLNSGMFNVIFEPISGEPVSVNKINKKGQIIKENPDRLVYDKFITTTYINAIGIRNKLMKPSTSLVLTFASSIPFFKFFYLKFSQFPIISISAGAIGVGLISFGLKNIANRFQSIKTLNTLLNKKLNLK